MKIASRVLKVIASSLYTILAYESFHRHVLLSHSGGNLYSQICTAIATVNFRTFSLTLYVSVLCSFYV